MNVEEIMKELKSMGTESTKKTLINHGATEPLYGVKIGDLKKIVKKVKKNYQLALDLYETGNSDAMYLAGLIADDEKMTKKDLQNWVKKAHWLMISEYTVAWVAAESNYGYELGLEWIDSNDEKIATAGWSTLAGIVSLKPNEELDIPKIKSLLQRIEKNIHQSPNRVRYVMNSFIICVGSYISELSSLAKETSKRIGTVMVDMGGTACKVPSAADYIKKVEDKGNLGKKKKTVKC
jgi:3-methyladenine DNA glycosylase AlkD